MARDDDWYPGMVAAQDAYREGGWDGEPQGMIEPGNIDLEHRPRVHNPDGSISTVRSMGTSIDGQEVLIPTVRQNPFRPASGWIMGDDAAIDHYKRTGQHLGKFTSPETSEKYAVDLHNDQARQYVPQEPAPQDPGESWGPEQEPPYGRAVAKGMQQIEDQFGYLTKAMPDRQVIPPAPPGRLGSLVDPGYQPSSILDPDRPAEARSYTPSARERLSQRLQGDAPTPALRSTVKVLTGSGGLGNGVGAIDFLPGGGLLGAEEEAQKGEYQSAAVNLMPGGRVVGKAGRGGKAVMGEVADLAKYETTPSGPGIGHNSFHMPPTGSKNPLDNVDVTFRGKEPKEFTADDWQAFGEHYGIKNIGPLSPLQTYKDVNGKEFHLPGGTEGKWTYVDLLHMKANPINPANVDRATHAEMQRKLGRTMTPEVQDDAQVWNGLLFGMTSPNNPLFPNQATASRMRLRDPAMLDDLASMIQWKPGDTVPKETRKFASDQIAARFGLNKGSEGGLGSRGTADYTRIAEMAHLFKQDPAFFRKKDTESWSQAVERISSQLPGLSMKTGSFGTVWQDPAHAAISAIDRHMARELDKQGGIFASAAERTDWENRAVKLWNDREVKRIAKEEAKNAKDGVIKDVRPADNAADFDDLQTKGGADGFMGEMLLSHVGKALTPKFRMAKGEINPNLPQHLRDADWISEPEKVFQVGRAYRQALDVNQRLADENGLNLFMSQWMEWDRIRNRFEPHENMFPGLSNAPAMSTRQMREVDTAHKETGHKTYGKNDEGSLKPTRTLEGSPSRMGYLGIGGTLAGGGALTGGLLGGPQEAQAQSGAPYLIRPNSNGTVSVINTRTGQVHYTGTQSGASSAQATLNYQNRGR